MIKPEDAWQKGFGLQRSHELSVHLREVVGLRFDGRRDCRCRTSSVQTHRPSASVSVPQSQRHLVVNAPQWHLRHNLPGLQESAVVALACLRARLF